MSSEDSSGESEPEDAAPREPDQPDRDDVEPIDPDQLMEEMQARRDEQREQVSFDWCETIRDAGERYREHGDVDAVADDLHLDSDDVREAITVYRLRFEEPPRTAAGIADKAGRAFFALDADIDETVDLKDRDYTVEDLVREYVGTIYLEYDVGAETVGDPVEQTSPELPIDLEVFRETIADAVSVSTGTLQSAVQPMLERRQKLIQAAVQPVVFRQQELIQAAVQPILNQQQKLFRAAMSPTLTAIAQQQESIATSAFASLTNSLDDIVFPESVLADLTAIQPAIDAAAVSTPAATTAGGFSTVGQPSVPVTDPTPSPTDTDSLDSVDHEVTPDSDTVDKVVEPSVDAGMDVSPVSVTVDATLPNPDTVSPELVYEIPALLVESMLTAGEARIWFTSLPYGHQITVVNVMLVSATFYVTRSASMAALSGFLSPAVRQLVIKEDEE